MMHLVTGASASGKSAYAEDLLVPAKSAEKYYIATMRPWGAEGAARVKKHRAMREGKGFQTIEAFHTLDALRLSTRWMASNSRESSYRFTSSTRA